MSTEIDLTTTTTLATIASNPPAETRAVAGALAMQKVVDERFERPLPRFLTELPWGGDNDEITDRIAAAVLMAEDPDKAQESNGTIATKDIVGKAVVVNELVVLPGDKEGGWGAFLLLDVTMVDGGANLIVNTGSKQVITRLARAWAEGQLPIRGAFTEISGTGKRGNAALAFIAEPLFT